MGLPTSSSRHMQHARQTRPTRPQLPIMMTERSVRQFNRYLPQFSQVQGAGVQMRTSKFVRPKTKPTLWQLVFYDHDSMGLDIKTFDTRLEADKAIAALVPDEYGEGGGIVIKDGIVVTEKLYLKHLLKEDYFGFLRRATEAPTPAHEVGKEQKLQEATATLKERLSQLSEAASEIASIKRECEAKHLRKPMVMHGRPSRAMVEFAQLFPGCVTFGGHPHAAVKDYA